MASQQGGVRQGVQRLVVEDTVGMRHVETYAGIHTSMASKQKKAGRTVNIAPDIGVLSLLEKLKQRLLEIHLGRFEPDDYVLFLSPGPDRSPAVLDDLLTNVKVIPYTALRFA